MAIEFKLQLLDNTIAVCPENLRLKRGSVLLPDWQRALIGEVIGVGPKAEQHGLTVGSRVSFGAAKGMDSVYNGAAIRIMKTDDVDFVLGEGEEINAAA